jgi:hypothetical protein
MGHRGQSAIWYCSGSRRSEDPLFQRCAVFGFLPLWMLVLGFVMAPGAPRFITQRPPHHHRDHGREQRLLERRNTRE